jgi:hypothetical protein
MNLFEEDLFQGIQGKSKVCIVHVISDKLVMGAGFAGTLNRLYPNILRQLRLDKPSLGDAHRYNIHENLLVYSMVAMRGLRSKYNPVPLDYGYLEQAMKKVTPPLDWTIHCPKFGAGLAGGSWFIIEKLIQEIWNAYVVKVYK